MKRPLLIVLLFAAGVTAALTIAFAIVVGPEPQGVSDRFVPRPEGVRVESWIENLEIPWSLVFLPDGRALVSERPGRIRLIEKGRLAEKPYATIDVARVGEGGLMGLAVHPRFPDEPYIYAMHTYEREGGIHNRVIRLRDGGRQARFDQIILDGIPGGRFHDGGRIAFGPDGMLYVCTGDGTKRDLAQDTHSLAGKILRITPEGSAPGDNPLGSPIYSYGHRNPQGLAWRPGSRTLFASEHGPSGEDGVSGHDEINVVRRGDNYGWPLVVGAPGRQGLTDPIVCWEEATPPSGITFVRQAAPSHLRGDLFVATLGSEALVRIRLREEDGTYRAAAIERWFASGPKEGRFGRLRDVVEGPDGSLYVLTGNRDGRGRPREGDDRILRLTAGAQNSS